jgi:hypothetical protein
LQSLALNDLSLLVQFMSQTGALVLELSCPANRLQLSPRLSERLRLVRSAVRGGSLQLARRLGGALLCPTELLLRLGFAPCSSVSRALSLL